MTVGLAKSPSDADGSSSSMSMTASSRLRSGCRGCWQGRTWSERMLLVALLAIFVAFTVATCILVDIYSRLEQRLVHSHMVTDDMSTFCQHMSNNNASLHQANHQHI